LQRVGFPGREAVLSRFRAAIAAGFPAQSYLFWGPVGSGKELTALEIARLVNCRQEPACRTAPACESCQKILSFQHPDVRWLGPAPASVGPAEVRELLGNKRRNSFYQPPYAASSRISIGDPNAPGPLTVRALLRFLRVQAFQGRYKVAVIADSHRMTGEAANALLKTLEEPPPASLIFLLAAERSGLLPTIQSRCQQVRFDPYGESELADLLVAWYDLAPGAAQELARAADGNGRQAVALLGEEAQALQIWAALVCTWIQTGREGPLQLSAEHLHLGRVPADLLPPEAPPVAVARDLAARRQRAMLLCEMLNLYYSEILGCRERGAGWRPRLPQAETHIRSWAAGRLTCGLLGDMSRIEAAKRDLDGNLNIGLAMATLFQDLLDHAQQDQERSRATA
jgi:DNA polymerase III delta prime subunit